MWKRRLQNKIKELRKDLSQLEAQKDRDISNFRYQERKYSIRVKRVNVLIEELKQRIKTIATKHRYQGRVDSYRPNRLFENNLERQFYRESDQERERRIDDQPIAEESKQF